MRHLPVVVISGMRQTGKSTLLQNEPSIAGSHRYFTLDDFAVLAAARTNPESLFDAPVIIDEVQRCPELIVAIKKAVDENRSNGFFILSGSANISLLGRVSETLAGRASYLALYPMTRRERMALVTQRPFIARFMDDQTLPAGESLPVTDADILAGGLPPACLGDSEGLREWFLGYVQTYVERDVRGLSQIADLVSFANFVRLAALRSGQVLSIASLARDAKLNAATAGRYLGLLEASFIVWRLPPFFNNRSSRLVKSPKLYFTDSGLAAHLADVTEFPQGRDSKMRG
ncbi:MAG: ATP-binding protein, partial [Spirochaetales bacterium]|nr:ATP-binding protein [Spirochaetales bacterium]